MIRFQRSLLFPLLLLLAAAFFAREVLPANAGIEPGPGKGWLTIVSRSNPDDAVAMARKYADRFPTVLVFGSSNGYYAVSLGWADIIEGRPLLQALISAGTVPSDSYFTAGNRFVQVIWSAGNIKSDQSGQFYQATRLQSYAATQPPPAQPPQTASPTRMAVVAGLDQSGDNYLSLRAGPGARNAEIARMRPGTRVTVTGESGRWFAISLANGMQGWAFGRYLAFENVPVVGPDARGTADSQPFAPESPSANQPETAVATAPAQEPKSPAPAIADQKRVALVMGNSNYVNTVALPNPRNDAAAMAAKLKDLGFQVVDGLDGTKAQMEAAVREFVKILPGADVALFFYAGHAMQVDGRNYMIPVDAKLEDSTALDFETIDLGVMLNFMNTGNRLSIALLDACRDNPLSRQFARNFGATRSAFIGRGLAAVSGSGEMLIGFATAPGEVALDGDGPNSPFTTALLRHIATKGLDVELMLKRVRQDVYKMTNQSQEPWVNSALRREFRFNP